MPEDDGSSIKIPEHIAVIMDGNGRWAKSKGLPRSLGHRAGMVSLRQIVKNCAKLGVSYLTVYALSTENWKRPAEEVSFLMKLFGEYLKKEVASLKKNNVRLRFLGDISIFSEVLMQSILKAEEETSTCSGLQLIIAINYGGRQELVYAARRIADNIKNGLLKPEEVSEKTVSAALYLPDIPDPDLIIRTSGEMRISNFLLWQIAYSEFYATDVLWPDFREKHLIEAIASYSKRNRRFGGVS